MLEGLDRCRQNGLENETGRNMHKCNKGKQCVDEEQVNRANGLAQERREGKSQKKAWLQSSWKTTQRVTFCV